jgi:hypothetical protein
MIRPGIVLVIIAGLACGFAPRPSAGQTVIVTLDEGTATPSETRRLERLTGAIHVHSSVSNGEYSIRELAAFGVERGIDFMAITDSFLTRVRYGIGPFRAIAFSRNRPGVRDYGVDRYLEAVDKADQELPITLLPATEVTPGYVWKGGLSNGLQLHGFDHHLLVIGLEDADALDQLPVIGNETFRNTVIEWPRLAPSLLFGIAGLVLLLLPQKRKVRLEYITTFRHRSTRRSGAVLLLAATGWTFWMYPFGTLTDPYAGVADTAAQQRLIDYVGSNGGLTFWSYPEARFPDVVASGATMVSAPHPDDLWTTSRYDGFEGLYGDTISITESGGLWDELLLDFVQGRRSRWPSAITGIDFHYFGDTPWYELDAGQTVLWAEGNQRNAVIDALRRGRGYAAFQPGPDHDLVLDDLWLSEDGRVALTGERLDGVSAPTLTALVRWEPGTGGPDVDVEFELIRDGTTVQTGTIRLPARMEWEEELTDGPHYYRLRLEADGYQILTNPIFADAG